MGRKRAFVHVPKPVIARSFGSMMSVIPPVTAFARGASPAPNVTVTKI